MTGNESAMIIVGAGQAGGRAALTLREAGHTGTIVLLGSESTAPYERPPLSKEFLTGKRTIDTFTFAKSEAMRGTHRFPSRDDRNSDRSQAADGEPR
jgi:3-phenylpropionate/trans-cinnamate dioxygenase ferredoxin reductase component